MKKLWFHSLLIGAFILLTACQQSTPSSNPNEGSTEEQTKETTKNEDEKDNVELLSPEKDSQPKKTDHEGSIAKENLLKSPQKIKHPTKDIEITYTDAYFTQEVKPSGEGTTDIREIMVKDKEIYFHVIADMYNDTKDTFHFGNSLGDAKVKLIYDGKHEFDFLATAESSDGATLGASTAEALTTTKAHYYAKTPIAVYNNPDKPLELIFTVGNEDYKVKIR